jgi:hypothetical protein
VLPLALLVLTLGTPSLGAVETVLLPMIHTRSACGQVLDPANEPIPTPSVVTLTENWEAVIRITRVDVDVDGRFCLANYGPGDYWIEVRAESFNPARARVIVGRRGPRRFNVILSLST